ncbi:MAG: tRNA (N(6)-L-threonylcarbamoyladenosine(37)-C(2))-methylthiotransferase MtaB [Clostridia bacterium]
MKVALETLGCKVNHYETQAMQELFEQAGWTIVPASQSADVYVINTCTVTQASDRKSRQLISRVHKVNPNALIAVVGCYAETNPQQAAAFPGVEILIGTQGRKEIVSRVQAALTQRQSILMPGKDGMPHDAPVPQPPEIFSAHLERKKGSQEFESLSAVRDGRTRATLKIQDGCVNFCSYCIIPYARGPICSRPLVEIARELRLLAGQGYREVVLTGIHLASYGRETGEGDLLDVLALIKEINGIDRVRLGSLEPKFVDERFVQAVAENSKICRQFHLSLQSGSDSVLRRMNRRYTTAEYAYSVALLNDAMPNCAVTTDVIAGFCGETPAEHSETLAFCERMRFARMHVFPFSVRRGTAAAVMDGQLSQGLKEARAHELIALGKRLTDEFLLRQIGTVAEVLIEHGGGGYTSNYVRVQSTGVVGTLVQIMITEIQNETAIGKELTQR